MAEGEPLLGFTEPTTTWGRIKQNSREFFAEFIGTAVLVTFGCGVIASVVLGGKGDWLSINLGWGLGLTCAIYVAGNISGAHLNPAVTLTLAIYRAFPWNKLVTYFVAQFLGAFTGAVIVYAHYLPAFRHVGSEVSTAGIFATYPQPYVGLWGAIVPETVGTFLLVLVILATGDENNFPAGANTPLILGLTLTAIGACLGYETGFALNPARDFGPRLFTFIAGWGPSVFGGPAFYFLVPLLAPFVGGVLAGAVYDGLIARK